MSGKPSEHISQIDSLRAIAIIVVVLNHALIARNFPLGGFGICMFLVLSGYFATRSLLASRWRCVLGESESGTAAFDFIRRRWARLLPPYYFVLWLAMVLSLPGARDYLPWNLLLVTNFGMLISGEWAGFFSPFWSLAALEQIMIFWPFVILMVRRRALSEALVLLILVGIGYRSVCAVLGLNDFCWFLPPLACLDSVAMGGLLAMRRREGGGIPRLAGVFSGALFGVIVAAKVIQVRVPLAPIFSPTTAAIFFAWLLQRCHEPIGGIVGAFLRSRVMSFVGRSSYSTFLVHGFVIYGWPLPPEASGADAALHAILSLLCSVLLGAVLHHCVERPTARLRERWSLAKMACQRAG